jgi:uncharacterized membrane protein YhfC
MYHEPDFQTYDYTIGGKMVVGRAVLAESYQNLMMSDQEARQQVKEKLISDMAQYMLENNLVEFMQQKNVDMTTTVVVRAYLAPNNEIKILRLANKIL